MAKCHMVFKKLGDRAFANWTRKVAGRIVIDLRWADLRWADLREADLCVANLRWADLREADLCGANLREANIDLSCWPLWCGSIGVKVDDRIAAQLLWHVGKIDTEHCSQMMKDAIQHVREMAASDVFSDEYKPELEGQDI